MRLLRDPAAAAGIEDVELRRLVEQRFQEIGEGAAFDPDTMGYFVVVEPGDSVAALEAETGCAILTDLFGESRFGEADFTPAFEWLMAHPACFEIVYVFNDDGYGIDLFVPKRAGVDPELLAMCATYADPAPDGSPEPSLSS
jgi:hypothetical protein